MMGLGIGDALGSSTEFSPFKRNGYNIIKKGFNDIKRAIQ